jgi:hypothetical protein
MKPMLAIITILACPQLIAQTDTTWMNWDSSEVQVLDTMEVPHPAMIDSVFHNLSMAEVTSGFLMDRRT